MIIKKGRKIIMIAILFENCDIEKRKISKTYKNEILKIDVAYKSKILSIYDQRPGFYHHMKKNQKIIIEHI